MNVALLNHIPCYEHEFYADTFIADPLPHYAAMRALGPVVYLPSLGNYAITRYDEVKQALRNFEFDARTECRISSRKAALPADFAQ